MLFSAAKIVIFFQITIQSFLGDAFQSVGNIKIFLCPEKAVTLRRKIVIYLIKKE
jgi:hypothetical protein